MLQRVPRFDTTVVYVVATQLPQYFLTHAPISVAVETFRTFLCNAAPVPTAYYLDLLQRFADLLVRGLHDSACYPPVAVTSEQLQIPKTALEEALLLLLLLQRQMDEIGSVKKVLEIAKLAYEAYAAAELWNEGIRVGVERMRYVVLGARAGVSRTRRAAVVPDRPPELPEPQPRVVSAGATELSSRFGAYDNMERVTRRVRSGRGEHERGGRVDGASVFGSRVCGPSESHRRLSAVRLL